MERPLNVVKELLENALDAGATKVEVELLDGGRALIRVADDGGGIPASELELAVERHATSKLREIGDLQQLDTYGFRGEALASVGAVAHLGLRSRTEKASVAAFIEVKFGTRLELTEVAGPRGTEVTVRDLFGQLPARQKFLKSAATEFGLVREFLLATALAYPALALALSHNGREVLRFAPAASARERLGAVLGPAESASTYAEVNFGRGSFRVEGFVQMPEHARPHQAWQVWFVNGRLVRDRMLRAAVSQALSSLLPKGLHASAILFITCDGSWVDVNAHPAKTEVRFADAAAVQDLVTIAVQNSLQEAVQRQAAGRAAPVKSADDHQPDARLSVRISPQARDANAGFRTPPAFAKDQGRSGASTQGFVQASPKPSASPRLLSPLSPGVRELSAAALPSFAPSQAADLLAEGASYLGQFQNCYLFFESGDDLVVVDQHAFHERILYEELTRDHARQGRLAQQSLLAPLVTDLPLFGAAQDPEEWLAPLAELGFEAEVLRGPREAPALAVHSIPAALPVERGLAVLNEAIAQLADGVSPGKGDALRLAFATMACHAAVRAGDALDAELVRRLMGRAAQVDFQAHCPHGRPVSRRFLRKDIAQWFLR